VSPPTKIIIGGDKGLESITENVTTQMIVRCWECDLELKEFHEPLKTIIDTLIHAPSAFQQEEIKAWQEEIIPCQHSYDLIQDPVYFESKTYCLKCDLETNLWLCLICGHVGCGRKQFYGTGGNEHALKHYEETLHPMVCKLRTITPEGTAGKNDLDALLIIIPYKTYDKLFS
jgi:ubiquitin carboxyl-terminal hydrolase 5/13